MEVRGVGGRVCVGYQQAASLGAWTVTIEAGNPPRVWIRAAVVDQDTFWWQQAPTEVTVQLDGRSWQWRNVQRLERDPLVLTAEGLPMSTRHP